jgi:hypothetical protein
MNRFVRSILMVSAAVPFAAGAQGASNCRPETIEACRKADDLYNFMLPQLGLALAGGHPTLGAGTVIGKLGHFSIGVRATGVKGAIPQFDEVSAGTVNADIPIEKQWIPGAAADAAIGIFRGIPVGVTHIGSLDGLVSVMYLPKIEPDEEDGTGLTVEKTTRFGFGARVGVLDESVILPEISVSYIQRGVPIFTTTSESVEGVQFGVDHLDIKVNAWRLILTKTFLAFAISGGIGGDSYKSEGNLIASEPPFSESVGLTRNQSRTNYFGALTLNLGPIKLGAEYGSGSKISDISTFNQFDPPAGSKLSYASVGLRLGF